MAMMTKGELLARIMRALESANPSEGRADHANAELAAAIADYVAATYNELNGGFKDVLGILGTVKEAR